MTKFYTYDGWFDTFEPIKNKLVGYDQFQFETYGAERDFVASQPNNYVWTEIDGDDGTFIVSGMCAINRIHYYITSKPWDDDMTEVPTWLYRVCDCVDDDGDPNPECKECDEGTIDIPCDSMVNLKQIYGEDAPIVK